MITNFFKNRKSLLLSAILLFVVIFSFSHLTTRPKLWYDEGLDMEMARNFRDTNLLKFSGKPECWNTVPDYADAETCDDNTIQSGQYRLNRDVATHQWALENLGAAELSDDLSAPQADEIYRLNLSPNGLYTHDDSAPTRFYRELVIDSSPERMMFSVRVLYKSGAKVETIKQSVFLHPIIY